MKDKFLTWLVGDDPEIRYMYRKILIDLIELFSVGILILLIPR